MLTPEVMRAFTKEALLPATYLNPSILGGSGLRIGGGPINVDIGLVS